MSKRELDNMIKKLDELLEELKKAENYDSN